MSNIKQQIEDTLNAYSIWGASYYGEMSWVYWVHKWLGKGVHTL